MFRISIEHIQNVYVISKEKKKKLCDNLKRWRNFWLCCFGECLPLSFWHKQTFCGKNHILLKESKTRLKRGKRGKGDEIKRRRNS